MAYQNKLFTNRKIPTGKSSRDRWNREYMISPNVAESLNTYRTFGIFPSHNDVSEIRWDENGFTIASKAGAPAVRSLFNKYGAVLTGGKSGTNFDMKVGAGAEVQKGFMKSLVTGQNGGLSEFRISNNAPFLDSPNARLQLKENAACSVKDLVHASTKGVFGRSVYSYSDFMYCKYLGRMSNNYMVTLRRYPIPVTDNMMPVGIGRRSSDRDDNSSKGAMPIGTMVTWMGVSGNTMEEILKYSYNMSWREQTAEWNQVEKLGGGPNNDPSIGNAMGALLNPTTREKAIDGQKIPAIEPIMSYLGLGSGAQGVYDVQPDHWDSNKLYGPIDRIKKNYQRGNEGIDWTWSFTLNFEYELRSYNGINPKQAMLDLLANILAVTYTTGEFWKGGYYGFEQGTTSTWQNMDMFKKQDNYKDYVNAVVDAVTQGSNAVKNTVSQITSADSTAGMANNFMDMLNKSGTNSMVIAAFQNKLGRPERYAYPSLLSEAPVGLWHVTIGNPRRPILSAGNMIVKNTTITHSGPLGLDDFPETLKVSVELERGTPRDIFGIESLYMKGNDRIFHSMTKQVMDMYNSAKLYKSGSSLLTEGYYCSIGDINSSSYENAADANVVGVMANDVLEEAFGDPDDVAMVMSAAEMTAGYWDALPYTEDTTSTNGSTNTGAARGITSGIPT